MRLRAWFAVVVLVAFTSAARGDELEFRPLRDGLITGAAAAAWITTNLLLGGTLAPDQCEWCSANGFDDSLRSALKWSDTRTASNLSDAGSYLVLPLASLGMLALAARHDDQLGEFWTDAGLTVESIAVAGLVQQGVKLIVARQRPDAHQLSPEEQAQVPIKDEPNLSFYSGHSSIAFAFAVSAGTIATIRGRRLAPVIWGVGLTLAATTAYLRIAADRHWTSDVLVGSAMGSLAGFLIPWLHRRPGAIEVSITSRALLVGGTF